MKLVKSRPLNGINLGGWLVLERWMTPSLFEGTDAADERAFMTLSDADARIKKHRDTFITERDFMWIAQQGITAVRIPIGHWILGDEGPHSPCITYLDWAIDMAEKYQIQVIVDLHRAPGSQDGHDLGQAQRGIPGWFHDPQYQTHTTDLVMRLVQRYSDRACLWGIQPLNEPNIFSFHRFYTVRKFYRKLYEQFITVARPGTRLVLSDGFLPRLMNGVVRAKPSHPVVLDVHLYQFFEPFDGWRTLGGHLRRAYTRRILIWWLQLRQPIIIGEWSGVISGKKMRRVPQASQRLFEPHYITAQENTYRSAAGQFYWTYKTEGRGIWNYRSLVEDGVILPVATQPS